MNNEDVVLTQLRRLSGQSKVGKLWISCPMGTHTDSTPSCGINSVAGKYPIGSWYCFGCGKGGRWNAIAAKLGLVLIDENQKDTHTKRKLYHSTPDVYADMDDLLRHCYPKSTPCRRFPEDTWRTIPTSLLEQHGCQCIFDPVAKDYQIVMPVWVGGELVGGVKATWERSDPSYVTTPGGWVKDTGLLGYDELPRGKPFVVVEGPRDKWRLTRDGVPAVAVLGALQWTAAKANLIAARNPSRVLLFTDGDAAGITSRDLLYGSLRSCGLEVKFVDSMRLTEERREKARLAGVEGWEKLKVDPANADPATIDKVRRFCESTGR